MANNGNIYRGQVPISTSNTVCVTITFYSSPLLVRVQGTGYAIWINKVLPSLAYKVTGKQQSPAMKSSPTNVHYSPVKKSSPANVELSTFPSTPIIHNSTPFNRLRPFNFNTESDHCNLHRKLLQSVFRCYKTQSQHGERDLNVKRQCF